MDANKKEKKAKERTSESDLTNTLLYLALMEKNDPKPPFDATTKKFIDHFGFAKGINYAKMLSNIFGDEEIIENKEKKHRKPEIEEPYVPLELKNKKVERFFKDLEKTKIVYKGKEVKMLDRSQLPWKFATKTLAAYVASYLPLFKVKNHYYQIETVAKYRHGSLNHLFSSTSKTAGSDELEEIVEKYKEKK